MPLTRSRENLNLMDLETATNCSFTVEMDQTNAGNLQENARRVVTRSQTRSNNTDRTTIDDIRLREMISESVSGLREEFASIISSEMRGLMENMRGPQANRVPDRSAFETGFSPRPPDGETSAQRSLEPLGTEKVLNIIRNWRIKFTGHSSDMTIDEFIYRVSILTTNNLQGNFQVLCRHAHILFEGKALEWFWRYHRQTEDLNWQSLTDALKNQYKDEYSDFEILEDIRRRKQGFGEPIDEYLEVISSLTNRMRRPILDSDLCETIMINLRSEIRHELLHLNISSISQLRKEVRKHEKFMKEVNLREQRLRKTRVEEIVDLKSDSDVEILSSTDVDEACALRVLKCWNCDKVGHSFVDCMKQRRIFCYGCGLINNYKPSCPKCSKKIQENGKSDARRK